MSNPANNRSAKKEMNKDSRVLVADDANTIRRLLKNSLRDMGFNFVDDASNGRAALDMVLKASSLRKAYDLMIVDLNMPELTGLELLKFMRSHPEYANIPFVMLTSENQMELVAQVVEAGVSQYIVKPFTNNILTEKIRSAWAKHHGK